MKSAIMLVLILMTFVNAKSQADYKKVMLQNIQALDTAKDAQKLSKIASTFAAIYEYKKDWYPLYYECLTYIKLSGALENPEQKMFALNKALVLLEVLPKNNDEVQVLEAWYSMIYLGIDRSAWPTYMPKITEALAKAEEINANNPRIYYLQGLMKYNMPSSMGGGQEVSMKLFQQSLAKFESYHSADEMAPSWGKKEVERYLSKK